MKSGLTSPPQSVSTSFAATQTGVYGRPKAKESLHAQTLEWLAALGATPAQVYIDATDYFNKQMDALGILSHYKMVNLFAGDDKAQAKISNIAVLGSRPLSEVNGSGLTYGASFGFQADGTTTFTVGFKPEDIGTEGGASVWMTDDVSGTIWKDNIGARNTPSTETYIMNLYVDGSDWYGYWGDNTFASALDETLTAGLYTVRRASSTDLKIFKSGIEKGSNTTSTTPGNSYSDFGIFGRHHQGLWTARLPSPNRIGGFAIDDGLIADGKRAAEFDVWAETMAMLGRNNL